MYMARFEMDPEVEEFMVRMRIEMEKISSLEKLISLTPMPNGEVRTMESVRQTALIFYARDNAHQIMKKIDIQVTDFFQQNRKMIEQKERR